MGPELLLYALAAVAFYAWMSKRLLRAARRHRAKMLTLADELLKSEMLDERRRGEVCTSIEMSFSVTAAWAMALLVTPAAIAAVFMRRRLALDTTGFGPKDLRRWHKFTGLRFFVTLSNSPAAAALCLLQLVVIFICAIPLMAVSELAGAWADDVLRRLSNLFDGRDHGPNHHSSAA